MLHSAGVSSSIGASEAARLLGVTTATLYAYVSRGRIERRTGADGRASLFALNDVEALAARSRRGPVGPRSTIDVRVSSGITVLRDDGLSIRGHELPELVRSHSFEAIADLLWTGQLGPGSWPTERGRADLSLPSGLQPVSRLAVAAQVLGGLYPDDDAAHAAHRLIQAAPDVLGAQRKTGSIAARLTSVWLRRPPPDLVAAVDTALGLLADHELATSTLAVRVAASVRASPMAAFSAGLAVVSGPLHGMASIEAHEFLRECVKHGVPETVAGYRAQRRRIPGFGHKVYRGRDPRFDVLLDSVRQLSDNDLVDEVLAEVGRVIPKHPNIDLALGALTHAAGLDDRVPIFAVARIAGWAAHYAEEIDAPPVRYRGIIA
jgi:citrate synthase